MEIDEVIHACHEHLLRGKFERCLHELDDAADLKLNSFQRWNVENNAKVATFLWDIERNSGATKDGLVTSTASMFLSLLNKIRSIPVDSISLSLEITVLHNYLLLQSLGCVHFSPGVGDNYGNHVRRTLQRVLRHMGCDDHRGYGTGPEYLFDVIFTNGSFNDSSVTLTCMVSLCCVWAVLMMIAGDTDKAVSCLASCSQQKLDSVKADQLTSGLFEVPFSLMLTSRTSCGTDAATPPADKVRLLQGLCLFCTPDKRSRSHTLLQGVQRSHWHPYTKYILAYLEYEKGQYLDAIVLLSQAVNAEVDSVKVKALHSSLFAACFSKLGKHHCAIEKNKEALSLDFTNLWPLYSLSTEYQSLGLHDAELESLNLLIMALESDQEREPDTLLYRCVSPPDQQISLLQAQYILARRCLQLNKFDVACQRYLDVLGSLEGIENFKGCGNEALQLPSVVEVYHETEYSLLKAKQYDDCVIVCDKVLSCDTQCQGLAGYHGNQSQDQSSLSSQISTIHIDQSQNSIRGNQSVNSVHGNQLQNSAHGNQSQHSVHDNQSQHNVHGNHSQHSAHGSQSFAMSSSGQQRKRLRSNQDELSPLNSSKDIQSLLYKADALLQLGKLDSASTFLESALEPLSSVSETNPEATPVDNGGSEPHHKRQRLDSDGRCAPTPSDHGGGGPLLSLRRTAADVYNHLGAAMSKNHNHKDALHFIRVSLQLHQDSNTAMYNLTSALWSLQRVREGSASWTKYRGLTAGSDSFHLANVLKRKKDQLGLVKSEVVLPTDQGSLEMVWDDASDHQMLALDIQCLENLIRTR